MTTDLHQVHVGDEVLDLFDDLGLRCCIKLLERDVENSLLLRLGLLYASRSEPSRGRIELKQNHDTDLCWSSIFSWRCCYGRRTSWHRNFLNVES